MATELTINDIVYYVISGGRPTIDRHPYEVPLILYNRPLEEIMAFGDAKRSQGRKPCVIIPSPALGGSYAGAWNNHTDPSGLLDNIAAHIDCYIVDPASAETPVLPTVWGDTAPSPQYIFWERLNQELYFRGSHNQFIQTFGFDPEDDPPAADPPPNSGTVPAGHVVMHMDCPHCGKRIY